MLNLQTIYSIYSILYNVYNPICYRCDGSSQRWLMAIWMFLLTVSTVLKLAERGVV